MGETDLSGKGFGIASLVTGILSLVTIQFIIISMILAVISVAFGIIGKKKGDNNLSKSGIALGIVTISITVILYIVLGLLDVSLFVIPSWYK